jgi:uncharacterized protein (DUF849 family)
MSMPDSKGPVAIIISAPGGGGYLGHMRAREGKAKMAAMNPEASEAPEVEDEAEEECTEDEPSANDLEASFCTTLKDLRAKGKLEYTVKDEKLKPLLEG